MEKLLLVNEKDEVVGTEEKMKCHLGKGMLHRAFSVYVFNEKGEILIQQRSKEKPLWPLYWSNSCCSHPRPGESYLEAGERRLQEELGFSCPLRKIDNFLYQAKYKEVGWEREVLTIMYGFYQGKVKPAPGEVNDWKWISPEKLIKDMEKNPEKYTPWFKRGFKRYLKIKEQKDKNRKKLREELKKISQKTEPIITDLLKTYIEKKFYKLITHQISSGGKRLRPALTLISGRMMGAREKDLLYPASGTEILHNATLITDDIIDHSETRRGKPTVWKQLGKSIAECICLDYTATTYLAANGSPDPQKIVEIYTKTFKQIVEGEIYDILFEQKGREDEDYISENRYKKVSLDSYYKMIGKKTATLLQSCCEIGGVCARAEKRDQNNLKEFGYNLGIAFQVQDDILDIFGEEKKFGKKIGKDIEERKLGNIVIFYALKELPLTEKNKILEVLQRKKITNNNIREAITLIKQTNARFQAFHLAEGYIEKAKKNLDNLPQNRWNKLLQALADFIIERDK